MPKALMSDIRTGSVELEDQDIDLEDLDSAYEQDLDQQSFQTDNNAQQQIVELSNKPQQITQIVQYPSVSE